MKIDVSETLGQRIVNAARIAVAMHLQQRTQDAQQQTSGNTRQRVAIGGAGPHFVTEDDLPAATGRAERLTASVRPSQLLGSEEPQMNTDEHG